MRLAMGGSLEVEFAYQNIAVTWMPVNNQE